MTALARMMVAALLLVPAPALAQSPLTPGGAVLGRFGAFSPQRAFTESAEGKAGIARLEALQATRATEIAERNKALQSQEQSLERSLAVLAEEVRIQRARDLEKFRIDVQRFIQDAQAEVAGVQRELESSFLARLRPAVEQVAKEKGLQLVVNLDDGSVVWADPAVDITPEVIARLGRADTPKHP
jgi:outer membrane protein